MSRPSKLDDIRQRVIFPNVLCNSSVYLGFATLGANMAEHAGVDMNLQQAPAAIGFTCQDGLSRCFLRRRRDQVVSATAFSHRTDRSFISAMSSLVGLSPKCVQLVLPLVSLVYSIV